MSLCTFSIVACDLDRQEWGVAVASKFLAAGAVVSWAQAKVGAIATQATAKVGYGPDGLALLGTGNSADETLAALIAGDQAAPDRQVGIVDREGRAAAHTGERCIDWAGHRIGEHHACQGNILTGPETLEAMAAVFERSTGELADRLMAALVAGDEAGGDRRGKQSAGILVVRPHGGYGGDTDRYLDLRVDDDPEPVPRLATLVSSHHLFFGESDPGQRLRIDAELAQELKSLAQSQGYYDGPIDGSWDDQSKRAFMQLIGNENLEERWNLDRSPNSIDQVALSYLRERFRD